VLGKRLRELRKQRNLTMKEFGNRFNLAESTISGYENETRKPDMDILKRFADFFEISVDYLLGRTDTLDDLDDEVLKLLNDPENGIFFKDYLSAPEEKKKQLRDFMKFLLENEKERKPGDKQK